MFKKITLLLLNLLFLTSWLFAANSGKIAGKVTDSETGEPLIGANVLIEGTAVGASADEDGDFFILNVQPGTYTITASMVGYTKISQTQIKVSIDRTTQVNFQLSPTTILGEEVVVIAQKFAVKRDVSQSEITATKEDIDAVPLVQDLVSYMGLQAGIDLSRDPEGNEMFIRGGNGSGIGMVVDGLTMTNNLGEGTESGSGGGPIDIINLSAIQEVSVIKGGFNAEYGNIRSGLLNVVTKEGKKSYNGSADFRYTPPMQKHRGANIYSHENYWVRSYVDPAVAWVGTKNGDWDKYTQGQYREFEGWNSFTDKLNNDGNPLNDITPQDARDLFIWQHALEGASELGHPFEGIYGDKSDHNLDISFSGPIPFLEDYITFFTSYRNTREQYIYNSTIDGVTNQNLMIKLNSQFSTSMRLGAEFLSGFRETNGFGGEVGTGGRGTYFPHVVSPMDIDTKVFGLTFDHVINPSTFYKIRVSYITIENDQLGANTIRDPSILKTFGLNGGYAVDEQPYGWLNDPGYVYGIADESVIGGVGADAFNLTKVKTLNLKLDLTSQVDKFNQVQGGVEVILDDYDIYEGTEGFDPTGNFLNEWNEKPYKIQGYIQDKLEFEGFIANVGVRLDYSSPNSLSYLSDPYSKYFSRPFKNQLLTSDAGNDAESQFTVSPRLGIAHPITTNSKLYFNYGHFYQLASAWDRHAINYGLGSSGITQLGNPNVLPQRTIAYELGYEHEFERLFLLRVTGYYRDITDEIGAVNYVNIDESVNYITYANDRYADTRGVELELRKNWGEWVTGWINYTYMVTTNGLLGREFQYQDPLKQLRESRRNPVQEKPLAQPYANANVRLMSPADWGPKIGDFAPLEKLSLNFLVSWATGEYDTWEPVAPFTAQNNIQWIDRWNVDMRISKQFSFAMFDINMFLDIINVLDLEYLTPNGFVDEADQRDYLNSLHLPIYSDEKYTSGTYTAGDDKVGDVRSSEKPYINMPNLNFLAWNPPRSVILGVRVGF